MVRKRPCTSELKPIQHGRDQRFLVGNWGDERREGESLFAVLVLDME